MSHERIEELLAVRSLDGLDGSDVAALERELAEHGDCAECRRLEDEFAETAAMLADSLTPEPVDPGMVEAILASAPPALVAVPDMAEPARDGRNHDLAERRGRRATKRTALGLAAAFILVMIGGAVGAKFGRTVPVRSAALGQTIVVFKGGHGSLAMAYTPGEAGAVLFGSGLPATDPSKGKVYEVWTITGGQPTSAGCTPSANGNLHTSVNANVGDAQLMAVTIESAACPAAPTTTPILTASISS